MFDLVRLSNVVVASEKLTGVMVLVRLGQLWDCWIGLVERDMQTN